MERKALKALQDSIEKWEKNAQAEDFSQVSLGSNSCPLCRLFQNHQGKNLNCRGCPVFEKTGKANCFGTPYYNFMDHIQKAMCTSDSFMIEKTMANARSAAINEVNFLKSLLPKEDENGTENA